MIPRGRTSRAHALRVSGSEDDGLGRRFHFSVVVAIGRWWRLAWRSGRDGWPGVDRLWFASLCSVISRLLMGAVAVACSRPWPMPPAACRKARRIMSCCRTDGCRHRGLCGMTDVAGPVCQAGRRVACSIDRSNGRLPGAATATPDAADATWWAGAMAADHRAGQSHHDRARPDGRVQCVHTRPCAAAAGRHTARGGRRCSSAPMPSGWGKAPHETAQGAVSRNAPHEGKAFHMGCRGRRSRSVLFSG
jgi:hypothetical protein